MKQKLIVLLMFLFTIIIYGQKGNYEVTAPELNIREQADKNSAVLGRLANKEIIQVEEIEGNWARITFTDENGNERKGYVSMKFLVLVENNVDNSSNSPKTLSDGQRNILIGAGIFGLICYIIALIKVRKGQMTIIVNWYDAALLIATFVLPIIGIIITVNKSNDIYGIIGCVLAGLCFLSSLVWSIMANNDNYYHAFLSVFAKVFLVFIAFFILLSILGYWAGRASAKEKIKKEGYTVSNRMEYRRNNENLSIWIKVLDYLVISLIGTHK